MPVGGNGVQRLRDQQIDVAIVQLQRGQARIIVAHVESGAQGFIILRDLAECRDLAFPAPPDGFGLLIGGDCVQAARVSGRNSSGNSGLRTTLSRNTTSTSGEKRAREFQDQPRPAPAPALLVVKNGLALRHQCIPSWGVSIL